MDQTQPKNIWISAERATELLGSDKPISSRWLRALMKRGKITAQKRGKRGLEVLLESLPVSAQEKYWQSRNDQTESDDRPADIVMRSLESLSEADREKLIKYAEALRAIPEKGAGRRRAIVSLALDEKVHSKTVRRDIKNLHEHGLAGLLRKKRADAGMSRVFDNQVIAKIKESYLHTYRPKIAHVHRTVVEKDFGMNGKEAPHPSATRRVVQSIDPVLVSRYRMGEKHFEDTHEPINLRRRPRSPREIVCFDHHQLDHLVRYPSGKVGRPWITMATDLGTREIYALYLVRDKVVGEGSYPGSDAICFALRQGLLKKNDPQWPTYGLFKRALVDLGRDFRSGQFRAACAHLDIKIQHVRGYLGRAKPVERDFWTLENDNRHLPGYLGSSAGQAPSRQGIKPEKVEPSTLLSIDEMDARLLKWVNEYNHRKSAALGGLSPVETLAMHVQSGFVVREIGNEAALNLILLSLTKRVVDKVGIRIFGRIFAAPEMWDFIGQTVDVRYDPARVGEIFVFKDDRFICRAENRALLEFNDSEETLERAREIKRRHKRRTEERMREILAEAQYKDPHARARAEERYDQLVAEERTKMAAGAEPRSVEVLLPEFAKTAKKLRAVTPPTKSKRAALPALDDDDDLKSMAELFKPVENPWLDFESVHCGGCGKSFEERETEPCREGRCLSVRYCNACAPEHTHRNPWLDEEGS